MRLLLQELEAEDAVAAPQFCTVFGLDVPLKRWFQCVWDHPSNPLPRLFASANASPSSYSPLST
jgi:hypothetical protein